MLEIAAHQPPFSATAAELLRNPHLQPYFAQYYDLSSVFLPVKSDNNSKSWSRQSQLCDKQKVGENITSEKEMLVHNKESSVPAVDRNVNQCRGMLKMHLCMS